MENNSKSPVRPHFSTGMSLLLAMLLGFPLALRTLTSLEPYPALLFPGAGGALPIEEGRAVVQYIKAYGRSPGGELVHIDEHQLLNPMPVHYLWSIVGNQFGQSADEWKQVSIKRLHQFSVPKHVPTSEDRLAARAWLARRVTRISPHATELVVRVLVTRFDLARGSGTESILHEIVIPFS